MAKADTVSKAFRGKHVRESLGDKTFSVINGFVLIVLACSMLFPFVVVALMSITPPEDIIMRNFIPSKPTLDYYAYILRWGSPIVRSFFFTIGRTVAGTLINLAFTVLTAYPLSKMELPGMKVFMRIFLFTMVFTGGMIPTYLVVNGLELTNTVWALLLPGAMSVYNMIIMRTFLRGIPAELEESARIDGCGEVRILWRIILPVSKPVLASLSVFYAVWHWNVFMDSVMYITDRKLWPLQLWLRELLINMGVSELASGDTLAEVVPPPTAAIAATVMIVTIPIIVFYPFMQKHFVHGIMIGSVKG